jgi:hypothetical protein
MRGYMTGLGRLWRIRLVNGGANIGRVRQPLFLAPAIARLKAMTPVALNQLWPLSVSGGGVLEHPADSYAWQHFGINSPIHTGWTMADWEGGWTCRVEQGFYGHEARKATWLYACHADTPQLDWGRAPGEFARLEHGYHSAEERIRKKALAKHHGVIELLSHKARARTPIPFRDLLVDMARSVKVRAAA